MPSIKQLMEQFEAEAREAASRSDPLAAPRTRLGEMLAELDGLAGEQFPRLSKARRNRLTFGLDNARREVRRALDALAPRGSG